MSDEKTFGYAEFINESGLEFTDISSEDYREYIYADNSVVRIDNPVKLNVSASGGHRVYAATDSTPRGKCFYVAPGWRCICWEPRKDNPHFVK